MKTIVPHLSFQYDPTGHLSDRVTRFSDPVSFRSDFLEYFEDTGRDPETCWVRLQELVLELNSKIPGNASVSEQMWMVGLSDVIPDRFRKSEPIPVGLDDSEMYRDWSDNENSIY